MIDTVKIDYPFKIRYSINRGSMQTLDLSEGTNKQEENLNDQSKVEFTGIPLYDSKLLAKGFIAETNEDLKMFLLYYGVTTHNYGKQTINIETAQAALSNNVFLAPYVSGDLFESKDGKISDLAGVPQSGIFSTTAIGGLDVTTIADGLAKFLVKRTKQELNEAFFTRLRDMLNDDKYRDLQALFPATWILLNNIGTEVYGFEKYIHSLRQAFKTDIDELLTHASVLVDNHPEYFETRKKEKASLLLALHIALSLQNDMHPADIIATLPMQPVLEADMGWHGALQTLQLLSFATRNVDGTSYWADINELRAVINDKERFRVFLGLCNQLALIKYNGIPYSDNTNLYNTLNNLANEFDKHYAELSTWYLKFATHLNTLDNSLKAANTDQSDSARIAACLTYFKAVVKCVEAGVDITKLTAFKNVPAIAEVAGKMKKPIEVSYTAVDLGQSLLAKNYASSVNHAIIIYELIFVKPLFAESNIAGAKKSAIDSTLESNISTLRKFAQVGTFMAEVSEANTSDEMAVVIENYALPSGSARIKKMSAWNVALAAYVGPYIGVERIKDVDPDLSDSEKEINTFGLTAPVGISVSKGFGCKQRWSATLFASAIDIGAITAFRFKDSVTAQVPTIQLKDIISPGLFLSFGIPKVPISLNIGIQCGPNLRQVVQDSLGVSNTYSDNLYVRYSASLCVDIPLLNLYNKQPKLADGYRYASYKKSRK